MMWKEKKEFGCIGKILSIIKKKSYTRHPSKIFLHILSFQNIPSIFFLYFEEKKTLFKDASANYVSFLRAP